MRPLFISKRFQLLASGWSSRGLLGRSSRSTRHRTEKTDADTSHFVSVEEGRIRRTTTVNQSTSSITIERETPESGPGFARQQERLNLNIGWGELVAMEILRLSRFLFHNSHSNQVFQMYLLWEWMFEQVCKDFYRNHDTLMYQIFLFPEWLNFWNKTHNQVLQLNGPILYEVPTFYTIHLVIVVFTSNDFFGDATTRYASYLLR